MACTTILVGKNASYDGSTMIARNDDSGSGTFTAKKLQVILSSQQPKVYKSKLSEIEIPLPEHPLRYTCMPNAVEGEGIWGAAGVNEENVSMTATETITSNPRVLGADPLLSRPQKTGKLTRDNALHIPQYRSRKETLPAGIGEEDLVILVLPYIHSAREGVERLGALLEQYGTYEMNGIAFQDSDEIWWLESIGGHHWMAKRVPDDQYVVMPNQLGIDDFDLEDALGKKKNHMCSADLREFIEKNHLDLNLDGRFNPRLAFGSHDDSDHVYNTPRAWFMERYLNPRTTKWDGQDADYTPLSDDIPWSRVPERKITVEDVKYVLSAHFQGTPYDPYARFGDKTQHGAFRPIGVNRTSFLSCTQLRPYLPKALRAIEWIAYGSNVFNAFVPLYTNVTRVPAYFSNTTDQVSTDNFYWSNRLIGALADAKFELTAIHIERYQEAVPSKAYHLLSECESSYKKSMKEPEVHALLEKANQSISDMLERETSDVLGHVLYETSCRMKNAYARSDA